LLLAVAALSAIVMLLADAGIFWLLNDRFTNVKVTLYTAAIGEVLRVAALVAVFGVLAKKNQVKPYASSIAIQKIVDLAFFGLCLGSIESALRLIGYQGAEGYEFCVTREFPFFCQSIVLLAPIGMHIALSAIYFPAMTGQKSSYSRSAIFGLFLLVAVAFHFAFSLGSASNMKHSAESLAVFSQWQLGVFMLWPIFGILAIWLMGVTERTKR